MDKYTIEQADKALRRHVHRDLRDALDAANYTEPYHNAGLMVLTTCKTCGAMLRIDGETGRLVEHWARHHPLRALLGWVLSLPERRAKPVHSETTESRGERFNDFIQRLESDATGPRKE